MTPTKILREICNHVMQIRDEKTGAMTCVVCKRKIEPGENVDG